MVRRRSLAGTFINSLSADYDNALRMQNALCSLGAVGIGSGTIAVELTAEVFFARWSLSSTTSS